MADRQLRTARHTGWFAVAGALTTCTSMVTPEATAGPVAGLIIFTTVIAQVALFVSWLARNTDDRKLFRICYACRAMCAFATFLCMYAVVNASQNLRRCVTALCDVPTMFGTRAMCLAPCHPPYAEFQVPAVVTCVIAAITTGIFTARCHLATTAQLKNLTQSRHVHMDMEMAEVGAVELVEGPGSGVAPAVPVAV